MKTLLVFLFFFASLWSEDLQTLRIYNYNDYIDKNILINFAKENNLKIRYEYYENNDQLVQKIKSQKDGFDLACPSINYISKLQERGYLLDINSSKLKNFNNINKIFLKQNNNSITQSYLPYFWGTIGIVYDKTKVKPINSWNDLWREDLKDSLLFGSDYRDMFGVILKSLGYSANTQNQQEIEKGYLKLIQLIPNIKAIGSEDVSKYFLVDKFSVGIVFNGDAKIIHDAQKNFSYIYPKEGAIQWMDGFVILKNGANQDLAYKFLDYILEPKNGASIANEIGYATANQEAYKLLDKQIKNDAIYLYPSNEVINKSESLKSVGEMDKTYKKYWKLFLEEYKKVKGIK